MTNQNLHKEFIKTAFDINKMKNKLMSLLLEIYEKEIYKNYNCESIFEYGFKYARLSKNVIEKGIRTLKNLEDKPYLKKTIETQGIHKVALIVTLASSETDEIFAKHVGNMSKSALEELAKEVRSKKNEDFEEENLFKNNKTGQEKNENSRDEKKYQNIENSLSKYETIKEKIKVEFDNEMEILFLRLKKKYAKDGSNKYALKLLLKKLDEEEETKIKGGKELKGRQNKKESSSKKSVPGDGFFGASSSSSSSSHSLCHFRGSGNPDKTKFQKQKAKFSNQNKPNQKFPNQNSKFPNQNKPNQKAQNQKTKNISFKNSFENIKTPENHTRYIKIQQKRDLIKNYNSTCAYPNCNKPYDVLHHRTAFSFDRSHKNIIPLCRNHHEFAHNGLIAYELEIPQKWKLNIKGQKTLYDYFYLKKKDLYKK